MPIFTKTFYYAGGHLLPEPDHLSYRAKLEQAMAACVDDAERERLLKVEAVEVTRHVTEGIREVIESDRRIRHLVLDLGVIPLATWAESLDTLADRSLPALRNEIESMARELEQGKIQGFPATMFLKQKPTFVTLAKFYDTIFELAENL